MKPILYFLPAILMIAIPNLAAAGFFPTPDIKGEEKLIYYINPQKEDQYINRKWGINHFNCEVTLTNRMEDTAQGKKLTTTTDGKDEKTGSRMQVVVAFQVTPEGLKQTLFSKKIFAQKTGEVIFEYEVKFERMVDLFPPNTYTSEAFIVSMRGMDFAKKQRVALFWWGSERSVVPLYTKVKSPEEVKVKAGKFLCHRVDLWVDLTDFTRMGNFLLKMVSPFLPVYCSYFAVEPPHHFIAFRGPVGPPGSIEVFTELMQNKTPAP